MNADSARIPALVMSSRMQGKLQETLGQVGSSTRTQLENMRQAWERVSSIENDNAFQVSASDAKQNPELEHRAQKVSERLSENVHTIANEPSLAFYRIQEHVRKTLPSLLDKKHEVQHLHKKIQGSSFDTEYAVNALNSMGSSGSHFQNIQELLKTAMFVRQQMRHLHTKRQQEKANPSMYRTSMMRTQTLDASMSLSDRERRAEFTQSVQLPTTTSLSCIDDTPRARSMSFNADTGASSAPKEEQSAQLDQQTSAPAQETTAPAQEITAPAQETTAQMQEEPVSRVDNPEDNLAEDDIPK